MNRAFEVQFNINFFELLPANNKEEAVQVAKSHIADEIRKMSKEDLINLLDLEIVDYTEEKRVWL